MNYIVGVDIGGTFTDCAVFDPVQRLFHHGQGGDNAVQSR